MVEKFADIELDVIDKVVCGKWIAAHVKIDGSDKYLVAAKDSDDKDYTPIAVALTYEGAKIIAVGLSVADKIERIFAEVDRGTNGIMTKAFDDLANAGYDADLIRKDIDQMMADGKSHDDIAKYLFANEAKYRKHDNKEKGTW